jgi:hypothetical protein
MLNNPNTALTKAIKNIKEKYGKDGEMVAAEVTRALVAINKSAEDAQRIINKDTSFAAKIGQEAA